MGERRERAAGARPVGSACRQSGSSATPSLLLPPPRPPRGGKCSLDLGGLTAAARARRCRRAASRARARQGRGRGPRRLLLPLSRRRGPRASDSNIAEPWSSHTSEEILDTEKRKEAESKSPGQKTPKQKTQKQKTSKQKTHVRRQRRRRRPADDFASFATYFRRVLKWVHTGLSLSQEAVNFMDSFVKDIFERVASEAARLARSNKRVTITSREIHTSVCLLLPGEIGKFAVSEGTKAVIRYTMCE
ncbi:histone H2B type W-T [Camelus dromedarius]|uniref:histone H2B type W-T n=1 Tax=Camelus dromedarius TaxID=9838 RepID=UPI00311A2A50